MPTPDLEKRFTFHPGQPEKYVRIRGEALALAKTVDSLCPDSREKSLALTKLEEFVMWAHAGIARGPHDVHAS